MVFVISAKVDMAGEIMEMYLAYNTKDKMYWTDSYLSPDIQKFETMFKAARFYSNSKFRKIYNVVDKPVLKQLTLTTVGPLQ